MLRVILVVLLLGVTAITARAQAANRTVAQSSTADNQYYLFLSPGVVSRLGADDFALAVGGGGERFLFKGAAIGLEAASALTFDTYPDPVTQQPRKGAPRVIWLALNGSYHFQRQDISRRFLPFLTAGAGLSGINNIGLGTHINYGVGFNHWRTEHLGVRVEFRRFLHSGDGSDGRFTGVRFGLAIR